MPLRSYKADLAGPPADDPLDVRGDHDRRAAQAAARAAEARLRPQQRRAGSRVRHRGGGEKQHYRRIDFKRDKLGVPARLATIEYDPNRSARIGLLHYRDGEKRYMLLPHGLKVGDVVVSGPGGRGPRRQRPAAREHPARHDDPQHRARPGQGRPDRPLRRRRPPSCSPRRATTPRSACPSGEMRRVPHALHGHDRPGQQPRPREPEPRQGRPRPPPGPATGSPRRRR